MIPFIAILFLVAFNVATVLLAERRHRAALVKILELALSLKAEQRVTTQLREMLDRMGVTTDIRPRPDGFYDLSFDARAKTDPVVRPRWRFPVQH